MLIMDAWGEYSKQLSSEIFLNQSAGIWLDRKISKTCWNSLLTATRVYRGCLKQ